MEWDSAHEIRYDKRVWEGEGSIIIFIFPTEQDNAILRQAKRKARNMKINSLELKRLHNKIRDFNDGINMISSIEFSSEIDDYYDEKKLFNFETGIFDKIALGYYLAANGPDKHMCIEMDSTMRRLFDEQRVAHQSSAGSGFRDD